MTLFFDSIITLLATFCGLILITGGTVFEMMSSSGKLIKIEASSLDPWMIGLCVLMGIRWLAYRKTPSPIWYKFKSWVEWACKDSAATKRSLVFLISVLSLLWIAHCLKHFNFKTDAYDLTFVHQSLFQAFSKPPLACDLCDAGTYFGEHLSFSLFSIAPLAILFKQFPFHAQLLFLLQAIIIGGSLWIGLTRGPLKEHRKLWLFSLFLIFCHRPLRNSLVWDLREDHLAFAFLLLSLISMHRHRIGLYIVFLVLALITKENVAVITPLMAAPILFDKSLELSKSLRRGLALATVGLSLAWLIVEFGWLIPLLSNNRESTSEIVKRFPQYGSTPSQVLISILRSPSAWWELLTKHLLNNTSVRYILILTGPFWFFLRGIGWWWVPTSVGILMNVSSNAPTQHTLNYHYELVVLPFMIFGLWLTLSSRLKKGLPMPTAHLVLALMIGLSLSGRWPGRQIQLYWPTLNQVRDSWYLNTLASKLPHESIVAADGQVLAQLSTFRNQRLWSFPVYESKDRLELLNKEDQWTGLPGRSPLDAQVFVLNLNIPEQASYAKDLLTAGAVKMADSPSGQYVVLKK